MISQKSYTLIFVTAMLAMPLVSPVNAQTDADSLHLQSHTTGDPETKEEVFWNWFIENENKIIGILDDQSFAQILKKKMEEYYPVLTFEIGPAEEGKYNFYVSCDGLIEGLVYVELLGTAAPELKKWNIIKYKQPLEEIKDIMIDDFRLGPGDISVSYQVSGKKLDLTLYIKEFDKNDDRFGHITFLLLDALLGEYAVMTKIGSLEFQPHSSVDTSKEIIPFPQLKNAVNSL